MVSCTLCRENITIMRDYSFPTIPRLHHSGYGFLLPPSSNTNVGVVVLKQIYHSESGKKRSPCTRVGGDFEKHKQQQKCRTRRRRQSLFRSRCSLGFWGRVRIDVLDATVAFEVTSQLLQGKPQFSARCCRTRVESRSTALQIRSLSIILCPLFF
jgi:hypothetical protein